MLLTFTQALVYLSLFHNCPCETQGRHVRRAKGATQIALIELQQRLVAKQKE